MPSGPPSGMPNFMPQTPTLPPPSTRNFNPATPKGMPPVLPFGAFGGPAGNIVSRGQPPGFHAPPFKMPPPMHMMQRPLGMPAPPGAPGTGMELALVGSAGPGAPPNIPVGMPPHMAQGLPGMSNITKGVPLPPPPPREDDSAFVRRVRLIYMDRVMREHQKQDLLDLEALGRPVPNWVFNLSNIMPYLVCTVVICYSLVTSFIYAYWFDEWQEEHWYYACITALAMVAFLLDTIRSMVITVVQLRKYQVRLLSRKGEFVVRKIQKTQGDESLPAMLRPKTKAKPTSAIPKKAPSFVTARPQLQQSTGEGKMPTLLNSMRSPFGNTAQGEPKPLPPPGARTPPRGEGNTPSRTPPKLPFGQDSPGAQLLSGSPGKGSKTPPKPLETGSPPRSGTTTPLRRPPSMGDNSFGPGGMSLSETLAAKRSGVTGGLGASGAPAPPPLPGKGKTPPRSGHTTPTRRYDPAASKGGTTPPKTTPPKGPPPPMPPGGSGKR